MDDSSVPLDELTGLPQYLPSSDSHLPAHSAQFAASAELPPSFGGGFISHADDSASHKGMHTQSAQLPPMHAHAHNGMPVASNGVTMHYNSADLPPVHQGDADDAGEHSRSRQSRQQQQQHRQHHSGSVLHHSTLEELHEVGGGDGGGPVAEADASFISMLCDGMTMMSASDAPHAGTLAGDKASSPGALPMAVDGAGGIRR